MAKKKKKDPNRVRKHTGGNQKGKRKLYDTPERVTKAVRSGLQKSIPREQTDILLGHTNPGQEGTLLEEILKALPEEPSGHDIRFTTARLLVTHLQPQGPGAPS